MKGAHFESLRSLDEAIEYFSDPDRCLTYLASNRWPGGVRCPSCGSTSVSFAAGRRRWECGVHHPRRYFTVNSGTFLLRNSRLPLQKWLSCVWLVANSVKPISSRDLQRLLGVTQKTAWLMLRRINQATQAYRGMDSPG